MLLFEREKGLQSYKAQSHLKRVMVPSSPPGKFVLKSCLQCQVHSSHLHFRCNIDFLDAILTFFSFSRENS